MGWLKLFLFDASYLSRWLSKLLPPRSDRKRLGNKHDQSSGLISTCARWVVQEFTVFFVVAFILVEGGSG